MNPLMNLEEFEYSRAYYSNRTYFNMIGHIYSPNVSKQIYKIVYKFRERDVKIVLSYKNSNKLIKV